MQTQSARQYDPELLNKLALSQLQLIEKADQFPLVMTMLGKWNIENAKPIIINRLEIDRIKPTRSGL